MNFMRNPKGPKRKIGRPKKNRDRSSEEIKEAWEKAKEAKTSDEKRYEERKRPSLDEPIAPAPPVAKPRPQVSYKRDSVIDVPVVHVTLINEKGVEAPFQLSFYGIRATELQTTAKGDERIQSAMNRHNLKGYTVSQIK